MTVRKGGIGVIEEGKLKGRQFIIPSEVWVEKGTFFGGVPEFGKACLIHQKFIPDSGCPDCEKEIKEKAEEQEDLGLIAKAGS